MQLPSISAHQEHEKGLSGVLTEKGKEKPIVTEGCISPGWLPILNHFVLLS